MTATEDNDPLGEILDIVQAAKALNISRRSLQELVKLHPHYALNGNRKLFSQSDIKKLWEAMREPVQRQARVFGGATPTPTFEAEPYADLLQLVLNQKAQRRSGGR